MLEVTGLLREDTVGEDLELTWRLYRAGYRVAFRPSALVYAGCVEVMHLHRIGMMTESSLDLPLWQVRLIMPLGGLLYIGYFVGAALHLLHGVDPFETEELR